MQKYILIYLLFLLVTSCEKDKFEGLELSIGNEIQVLSLIHISEPTRRV